MLLQQRKKCRFELLQIKNICLAVLLFRRLFQLFASCLHFLRLLMNGIEQADKGLGS